MVEDIITWATDEAHQDQVALLLDQAGTGKTVVMRDVLCRLEDMGIAVLAIKADLQLSGLSSYAELPDKLHLPDSVERVVERLAQDMCVVVLIDQIDALSLSLAHDQQALNTVLDLVARLRYIPHVRTLLSCRIFDLNTDPRLKQTDIRKTFPIQELSDEEIKDVLTPLGIDFDILSP